MTLDRFYLRERMAGLQFLELTAPSPPSSRSCSRCSSRRPSPSPSRSSTRDLPSPLLDLLSNSLILHQTAPYLPAASVCALLRVNSRCRDLLLHSPETFRYLDLTRCKSVGGGSTLDPAPIDRGGNSWRSERMDEALTEDEFYSGPLLGVFNRLGSLDLLRNVATLVLDGLTVTADVVREIVSDDRYNVRILSLRGVKHLNERKLRQALRYAVRPSRPEGTPKLKGLYIFGPRDVVAPPPAETPGAVRSSTYYSGRGVMDAQGAQIGTRWNARSVAALDGHKQAAWYGKPGRVLKRSPRGASEWAEWAELLAACEGLIAFDAVLCRGPRHDPMVAMEGGAVGGGSTGYLPPAVASITLSGCEACGSSCEGPAVHGHSPQAHLPLLAPVPLHAPTPKAAQRPAPLSDGAMPCFIARCEDCLKARWCERCDVWWDEGCYADPAKGIQRAEDSSVKMGSRRECIGCGFTVRPRFDKCLKCTTHYSRTCKHCGTGYCLDCNEGSSHDRCDWCNHSGRRTRELY